MFEPRPGRVGKEQWRVADDEVVTIRPTSLVGELVILEPQASIHLPSILQDVCRGTVPWQEHRAADA
jgi:hypothetical protein